MSLMQVVRTVNDIRRQIDQQQRLIDSFSRSNRDNMSLVRTWLHGSAKGADRDMLSSLDQAEESLKSCRITLARADQAASRVNLI